MLLTVVLEKTIESPLDSKKIKPVNPKWNQLWIFIGSTDAEAKASILWPPDVENWLTGKDWCWERLSTWGEEGDSGWDGWMASPSNGHEFAQTVGDGEGQRNRCALAPRVTKNQTRLRDWTTEREMSCYYTVEQRNLFGMQEVPYSILWWEVNDRGQKSSSGMTVNGPPLQEWKFGSPHQTKSHD